MLLNNNKSIGRSPDRELWERLRCNNLVRLLRDGEMLPARPLEGSEISLTVFSSLQLIPSHEQQSVPRTHDILRPPLCSELSNEVEEGALLLLCAGTGGRGKGEQQQQHNTKLYERYGEFVAGAAARKMEAAHDFPLNLDSKHEE
uniref:Uncharacterized protein n=1 Tax=Oryza punctata TaxID=4537 RepID=A0A0E0LEZ4_ORYPU